MIYGAFFGHGPLDLSPEMKKVAERPKIKAAIAAVQHLCSEPQRKDLNDPEVVPHFQIILDAFAKGPPQKREGHPDKILSCSNHF